MESPYESELTEQNQPPELRVVENADELYDPGILGALTEEQVRVMDLLTLGIQRHEIARLRGAQTEEIFDVIDGVEAALGAPNPSAAAYILLKENIIKLTPVEVPAARHKVSMLADWRQRVLGAVMTGRTYGEAGSILGMEADDVRSALDDITHEIQSYSAAQTVRIAYAGGVEEPDMSAPTEPVYEEVIPGVVVLEVPAEPQPEIIEDTEAAEPEPPVARQHIYEFLSWMYPRENLEGVGELSDERLAAIADAIRAAAKKYDDSLRKPKKRHIPLEAIGYMDLWLQGNGIPKIANLTGKNDGNIRLSLEPFAKNLGSYTSIDEILKPAPES
jgi:hypothetical protein